MCVCVCVCGTVALWYTTSINNQNPVLWGFWTMSSPVNRILATTSTINQDPALWRFWIMSNHGSRFLDRLNTVYIQAKPTLWGFCIMSRPVSRVLVILYTTTPQPNTPTSYLPACRFRRWVGLLARTLRGFPNQSQIKSPVIRPPQVGNDGKAGPPGYVGKTATETPVSFVLQVHFTLSNLPSSYNPNWNETKFFLDAHNKARQASVNLGNLIFTARSPSTADHSRVHCSRQFSARWTCPRQ